MVHQIQGGRFLFCCYRCFNHPIKLIIKDFVCFFNVFEGETVSNQRSCVNLALLDE
jgi:hypothetical protein